MVHPWLLQKVYKKSEYCTKTWKVLCKYNVIFLMVLLVMLLYERTKDKSPSCFRGIPDANTVCISFVEAAPRAAAQGHDSHKLFFHTWRIQDALFQDNLIFMSYFSSLKIDHLLMQVHLVIDLRAMAWA